MHWFALGTALLVAVAIIAIGTQYIVSPLTATRSFGLPLPENCTNIASPQVGARHRIGVDCTGVHDAGRAQRDRPHPACGSHHPRWRHAGHSCGERLNPKAPSACTALIMVFAAIPLMIGVL
jgi:hypothetical protein